MHYRLTIAKLLSRVHDQEEGTSYGVIDNTDETIIDEQSAIFELEANAAGRR